ncbi:MAG: right-handed parallel beta-helix repeat-containing protein [Anaerolineae bacterium]|nr:right-handed parallel beta-helix repeat-containing protein [Anaerolineae bacterium]
MKKLAAVILIGILALPASPASGVAAPEPHFAVAASTLYVDGSLSANCAAGTYSVAARDCSGSDGDAYATIEEGVNAALPGDAVQVRGGLYHEQVDIRVNGEAGNRIVIQNYPGEAPVLEGSRELTGWTQSTADDPHLTVQGEVNPHYASIYRTPVSALPESQSPYVEHLVVLYENGEFLLPAQDPDQPMIIQNQRRYIPIEEESVGLTDYLIDSDHLTQPDNYWAGASVWVWVHAENNNIQSRVITSSNQLQRSITFDAPLSEPLSVSGHTHPDAYSIYNHPHLLDQPGEYFYTPEPDGDGDYWLYVWPRDLSDLADKIRINHEQMGFFPRQTFGNYVTLDGFEIRGFSGNWTRNGGVIVPYGYPHTGLHVKNCNIHHNYGDGISLYQGTDDLIAGNTIDTNFGAGLEGMMHTNLIIKDNIVRNHEGTNVSFDVNERMEITGNRIGGFLGTHGNGMAIYDGCNDVLVAGNIIAIERNVPLTFNTMGNLVLYNNILYSGDSTRIIASWSMGTGYHLAFNNLILGADTEGAAYFRTTGNKVFRNNIVDGGRLVGDGGDLESTYNLYTAFVWDQPDLDPTEIDGRDVNKADLFADYAGLDFHLKSGSPARDAGVSAHDIIQAYNLPALFPSYNFYADMDGNSRPATGAWDLGPYRFVPDLDLRGQGADRAIRLDWTVNTVLPATTTWMIAYESPGSAYLPVTGILSSTRAYTLPDLTNGVWYTVTLNAMLGVTPILTDTVVALPAGVRVYLPLVLR